MTHIFETIPISTKLQLLLKVQLLLYFYRKPSKLISTSTKYYLSQPFKNSAHSFVSHIEKVISCGFDISYVHYSFSYINLP